MVALLWYHPGMPNKTQNIEFATKRKISNSIKEAFAIFAQTVEDGQAEISAINLQRPIDKAKALNSNYDGKDYLNAAVHSEDPFTSILLKIGQDTNQIKRKVLLSVEIVTRFPE